jgi:uncharacterized protein YhbP (UPF0306 family)
MYNNIKKITGGEEKENIVIDAVKDILEQNYVMSITTIKNNKIWSAPLYYSYEDDLSLFFLSDPKTRHADNILSNSVVSGCIYDSHTTWGDTLRGLQFIGKVKPLSLSKSMKPSIHYLSRYKKAKEYFPSIKDLFNKGFSSKPYQIQLEEIQIYDEKTFGSEGVRKIYFNSDN